MTTIGARQENGEKSHKKLSWKEQKKKKKTRKNKEDQKEALTSKNYYVFKVKAKRGHTLLCKRVGIIQCVRIDSWSVCIHPSRDAGCRAEMG